MRPILVLAVVLGLGSGAWGQVDPNSLYSGANKVIDSMLNPGQRSSTVRSVPAPVMTSGVVVVPIYTPMAGGYYGGYPPYGYNQPFPTGYGPGGYYPTNGLPLPANYGGVNDHAWKSQQRQLEQYQQRVDQLEDEAAKLRHELMKGQQLGSILPGAKPTAKPPVPRPPAMAIRPADLVAEGLSLFQQREYEKAGERLKTALMLGLADPNARFLLAQVEFARAAYGPAAQQLQAAIEQQPDLSGRTFQPRSLYVQADAFVNQLASLAEHLQKEPKDADALYVLAFQLAKNDEPQKAKAILEYLATLEPAEHRIKRLAQKLNITL